MPANKFNLIYKLDGEGVESGIDVFKLSPLLLSVGKLIQISRMVVKPSDNEIGINIKPFQKGSFVIELTLFAKTNYDQLIQFINQDDIKNIKELLEWIGIIGASGGGVIGLYKYLQGQPKSFEEVNPDEIKITSQEGTSITINKSVFILYQNTDIQAEIYNIYGNFLGQSGIEKVISYDQENNESKVEVKREDVPFFNPANTIPSINTTNEKTTITRTFLNPKRISLEGESDNWSLRRGKDVIITANVRDKSFLDQIKSGQIRLAMEDALEVDLLEMQTIDQRNEITVRYEILKVVDYRKASVQQSFFE